MKQIQIFGIVIWTKNQRYIQMNQSTGIVATRRNFNALEHVRLNNVNNVVIIEHADLTTLEAARFDLVLANIISGVLIPNLPLFRTFLKPRGTIIFSGILDEEESRFVESLQNEGFKQFNVTRKDEWITVHALV